MAKIDDFRRDILISDNPKNETKSGAVARQWLIVVVLSSGRGSNYVERYQQYFCEHELVHDG